MHGTYDKRDKPIMAKKPVPKPPATPKGKPGGKVTGKPFPAKGS